MAQPGRGHYKIFLGMAAGVGKTYRMLQEGQAEKADGCDVVVGILETPVSARLSNAVVINGDTVIPAGSVLTGTVTDVERSGRVKGRAHIAFAFNEVRMNNGREDIRTDPVNFDASATKGEDATKIGIGAGAGAVIGGLLGGKDGAAKGAAVGGGAGTGVVLATKGKEMRLAPGADVTTTLTAPLTVRVRTS